MWGNRVDHDDMVYVMDWTAGSSPRPNGGNPGSAGAVAEGGKFFPAFANCVLKAIISAQHHWRWQGTGLSEQKGTRGETSGAPGDRYDRAQAHRNQTRKVCKSPATVMLAVPRDLGESGGLIVQSETVPLINRWQHNWQNFHTLNSPLPSLSPSTSHSLLQWQTSPTTTTSLLPTSPSTKARRSRPNVRPHHSP